MALVVALGVIALMAFASVKIRCYVCFNLIMIGFSAWIAGGIREEALFTFGGGAMLICGLLIMYVTSLKVEKSRRFSYMLSLFLSGFFSFLHMMLIMLIITIPFAGFCKMLATDYRERVLVDANGSAIGKVYVDDSLTDPEGNRYSVHDPY